MKNNDFENILDILHGVIYHNAMNNWYNCNHEKAWKEAESILYDIRNDKNFKMMKRKKLESVFGWIESVVYRYDAGSLPDLCDRNHASEYSNKIITLFKNKLK